MCQWGHPQPQSRGVLTTVIYPLRSRLNNTHRHACCPNHMPSSTVWVLHTCLIRVTYWSHHSALVWRLVIIPMSLRKWHGPLTSWWFRGMKTARASAQTWTRHQARLPATDGGFSLGHRRASCVCVPLRSPTPSSQASRRHGESRAMLTDQPADSER